MDRFEQIDSDGSGTISVAELMSRFQNEIKSKNEVVNVSENDSKEESQI